MDEIDELLTIPEFASPLKVKESCVRRWIRERKIEFVHVGRLVRIPRKELIRIIKSGKCPVVPVHTRGAEER